MDACSSLVKVREATGLSSVASTLPPTPRPPESEPIYVIVCLMWAKFITVMPVLKFHIVMLDLWIAANCYYCKFICVTIVIEKHIGFFSSRRVL